MRMPDEIRKGVLFIGLGGQFVRMELEGKSFSTGARHAIFGQRGYRPLKIIIGNKLVP